MLPRHQPDRIRIAFDDHRLVNNTGLILPATLALHLGLPQLVDRYLDLGRAPGRANTGDKMMTLVASALAGGDCIDDADVLRTGGKPAPWAVWSRRPPPWASAQFPVGARPPTGPGESRVAGHGLEGRRWIRRRTITIDLDSTICETYGLAKEGARHHGYTGARGYHPLLAVATGTGDVLMSRLREGRANTARGAAHFLRETVGRVLRRGQRAAHYAGRQRLLYPRRGRRLPPDGCPLLHHHPPAQKPAQSHRGDTRRCLDADSLLDGRCRCCGRDHLTPFQSEPDAAPVRLIIRRVQTTPGSQLALFATYSYHGFITDRDGETLELEADHRRHAEIENAIRDLKYGVGLNHLPSGRFAANGAWLAVQVMAHNLARWTARIGLGEQIVTTKTLRRRFFALAGRITRSARRLTLHLPQRWPWETQFSRALARLRAIPLPACS